MRNDTLLRWLLALYTALVFVFVFAPIAASSTPATFSFVEVFEPRYRARGFRPVSRSAST